VFVGTVEAARGLSFEAVFVPGLAEKLFPHKIVEEPILVDAIRPQLSAGLITNEDRLAQERLALAIAALLNGGSISHIPDWILTRADRVCRLSMPWKPCALPRVSFRILPN
jgi:hypothetical protein